MSDVDYDFRSLAVSRHGDVLRVAIDHPERRLNTVDALLHEELTELFSRLRKETRARAVLLTGKPGVFSAGGEFSWFPTLADGEARRALHRDAKRLIWDLLDVELPIVAAISGPAIGLGASIALLCDVVFMSETATLADPHVLVGLVAGDGGAAIWPLAVGPALAKRYLLTGDPLGAEDARRMGLVTDVSADDRIEAEAMAMAERLAAGAPLAVQYTKLAVNKLVKDALNVAFDTSTALELVTFNSEDHAEALAARRERRPPKYRGR